jgi:superfamily II DNA/RNA helicase
MEQKDRERALIKFRNGSTSILLATDLAARGIDIPELKYIIHFELPIKLEEFTHRNGRTARVDKSGIAFVLKAKTKALPDFMPQLDRAKVKGGKVLKPTFYSTLFISGGRKDKISKGDIAGMFFKQGNLSKDELGTIELKSDCAFVAVPRTKVKNLIAQLNNTKIKKRKIRLYEI